MLMTY